MTVERNFGLKSAVGIGAVLEMQKHVKTQEKIRENEFTVGLTGECALESGLRPAERHSNGAREARKAQQF